MCAFVLFFSLFFYWIANVRIFFFEKQNEKKTSYNVHQQNYMRTHLFWRLVRAQKPFLILLSQSMTLFCVCVQQNTQIKK